MRYLTAPNPLLGQDLADFQGLVEGLQEPSYRAQQLFESIYRQRVSSVEEVSTWPLRLRQEIAGRGLSIGWPKLESRFQSADGTGRYLLACTDRQTVETV